MPVHLNIEIALACATHNAPKQRGGRISGAHPPPMESPSAPTLLQPTKSTRDTPPHAKHSIACPIGAARRIDSAPRPRPLSPSRSGCDPWGFERERLRPTRIRTNTTTTTPPTKQPANQPLVNGKQASRRQMTHASQTCARSRAAGRMWSTFGFLDSLAYLPGPEAQAAPGSEDQLVRLRQLSQVVPSWGCSSGILTRTGNRPESPHLDCCVLASGMPRHPTLGL